MRVRSGQSQFPAPEEQEEFLSDCWPFRPREVAGPRRLCLYLQSILTGEGDTRQSSPKQLPAARGTSQLGKAVDERPRYRLAPSEDEMLQSQFLVSILAPE